MSSTLSGRFEGGRLVLSRSDSWMHYRGAGVFLVFGPLFVLAPTGDGRLETTLAGVAFLLIGAWWARRQWRALAVRVVRTEAEPEILRQAIAAAAKDAGWTRVPNADSRRFDFTTKKDFYLKDQEVRILFLPGEVQFNSIAPRIQLSDADASNMDFIEAVVTRAAADSMDPRL